MRAVAERAARRQAVVNPALKLKRWKIGRLVTESGVGKATVYGYMNGMRSWIKKENRDAICQCLDLEVDNLPE
jgi:ABC-type phosphate transport system ATPase subunit